MSEEILSSAHVAKLQAEISELRGRAERAEAALDIERQLKPGRYAFYHRHLALSYVRRRDLVLHHEASSAASRQIADEGGKSYTDVVGELEQALAEIRERDEHQRRALAATEQRAEAAEQAAFTYFATLSELEDFADDDTSARIRAAFEAARDYTTKVQANQSPLQEAEAQAALYRGTIDSARHLLRARPIKTPFDDDVIRMLEHTLSERNAGQAMLAMLVATAQRAERAEAEAAAWIAFVREAARQLEGGTDRSEVQSALYDAVERAETGQAPGQALLAEAAAAQALAQAVQGRVDDSGRCVVCGATVYEFGNSFPHADDCALVAYDQAVKARSE